MNIGDRFELKEDGVGTSTGIVEVVGEPEECQFGGLPQDSMFYHEGEGCWMDSPDIDCDHEPDDVIQFIRIRRLRYEPGSKADAFGCGSCGAPYVEEEDASACCDDAHEAPFTLTLQKSTEGGGR